MLFFRSEEMVRDWCVTHGHPLRPVVTMAQLWALSVTWYATRLHADSRRPQPDEMRAIFSDIGLKGDFWDPRSDAFA